MWFCRTGPSTNLPTSTSYSQETTSPDVHPHPSQTKRGRSTRPTRVETRLKNKGVEISLPRRESVTVVMTVFGDTGVRCRPGVSLSRRNPLGSWNDFVSVENS